MPDEARVLIIEDNDALRAMLFTVLRHQPLGVDTAANLGDAMGKVHSCDYALILIDMNVASGDAEKFLTSFREARPEAKTFIIAVRDPRKDVYIDPQIVSAILNKPLEIDTMAELVRECALVVPPPDDPLPCPHPAESEIRSQLDRGGYLPN
jgi:DNA-binding NtrC family response regulator